MEPEPVSTRQLILGGKIICTIDHVLKMLCPKATAQEAAIFLALCQHIGANPWLGEAWLIPMPPDKDGISKNVPALSRDFFLKRAYNHPRFSRMESGVIGVIESKSKIENAVITLGDHQYVRFTGTWMPPHFKLVAAWARIFRLSGGGGEVLATEETVDLSVATKKRKDGTPTRFWLDDPGGMIQKSAEKRALKKAFPDAFNGESGFGEVRPIVLEPGEEPALPPAHEILTDDELL